MNNFSDVRCLFQKKNDNAFEILRGKKYAAHFNAIHEQTFICNICPCSNSTLLGLKVFVFMSIVSVFLRYELWVNVPVERLNWSVLRKSFVFRKVSRYTLFMKYSCPVKIRFEL